MQKNKQWQTRLNREFRSLDFSPSTEIKAMDCIETAGLLAAQFADCSVQTALIVADSHTAEALVMATENFRRLLEKSCIELTVIPELQGERRSWIPENEALRAAAMSLAQRRGKALFIGSANAFLGPAPDPAWFRQNRFSLAENDQGQTLESLLERLIELDYDHEIEVRVPGEFAHRGGIVDIFSPLYEYPVRIEFFGDQIDRMRFFNPETQRSVSPCPAVDIVPRGKRITAPPDSGFSFVDYLASDCPFLLWSQQSIAHHLEQFGDQAGQRAWSLFRTRYKQRITSVSPPEERGEGQKARHLDWTGMPAAGVFPEPEIGGEASLLHWQILRGNLQAWQGNQVAMVAACGSRGEAERLSQMMAADPECRNLRLAINCHRLPGGVYLPAARVAILSERELFGKASRPELGMGKSRYQADYRIHDRELPAEGDYTVHAVQGIAIYHGIREIEIEGLLQEVIELEFADQARLYLPMTQSWLISRYIGSSRKPPKLSRIGDAAWKKASEKAAASAHDLAAELLRIEALRKNAEGFSFAEDKQWEPAFAAAFPYTETADQEVAIREVLADMEKPQPMDRLLCGDVGYGKTEVAMRAAFRAVTNGRQVAVLVPTTLLAQQHFHAFSERMAEYPVNLEMLSRFRTGAEQQKILDRLAEGGVDILIGTHRMLQKDVVFADLGLIVIDEEQRFGVKDKEKLKHLRASVDILTMTATPIPRTLHFSLSGIRNLSTIMTPPAERLPVTTIVAQNEDTLLRGAILRELERGGQVFYLHNRVHTIAAEARRLRRLLPEARFITAHGQMPPAELEQAMERYLQHDIDVLVCTTIIESGLDIPSANTIIIQDADRFGLAELYQLRGRVGRYHHQAYAYLLLSPAGMPTGNARQRLTAIRQYSRLGAGINLALRDLEIRGAGNIIGSQQSGHIAAVGFEFYCELLQEAVARLKKQPLPCGARHVSVTLETIRFGVTEIETKAPPRQREPAGIPAWYMVSEQLRLQYYRRFSGLASLLEWQELREEIQDRFGEPPQAVHNLLQIARIRLLAAAHDIFSVAVRNQKLLLETSRGLLKNRENRLPRLQSAKPRPQLNEIIEYLEQLSSPRQD